MILRFYYRVKIYIELGLMHDPVFTYAMLGLTTVTLAVITLMSDNEKAEQGEPVANLFNQISDTAFGGGGRRRTGKVMKRSNKGSVSCRSFGKHNISLKNRRNATL
jgi:hypothetical protein